MQLKRFALCIAYDGTNYCGWQVQPNGITVQEVIEKACKAIAKQPVTVYGSGRTDSGVHALKQYAHIDWPVNMSALQVKLALNTKLPADIRITEVFEPKPEFHARFSAIERRYLYFLDKTRTPFNRFFTTVYARKNIKPSIMRSCFKYLLGRHDFTSFCQFNPDLDHHFCTLKHLELRETDTGWVLDIRADRFLHNMVRRIMGTLVSFGHCGYKPEFIKELLDAKRPNQRYISTAPANGLFLADVIYPNGLLGISKDE